MIPRQDSDHPIDRIRFGLMVAIGGEDASETIELLKEQETVARRELEEVPKRAEDRGQEFLEFSEETRHKVLEQLQAYLDWIISAREALEQNDSGETVQAYEASQEILPELNAALDAYSRAFAGFGPYQTAEVNTLERLLTAVKDGELEASGWTEYCNFFADQHREKLKILGAIELPGQTLFKSDCQEAIDLLVKLSSSVPSSNDAAEPDFKSLDDRLGQAVLYELEVAAAENGPTGIPATNVMIDYLTGWAAEAVSIEHLGSVIDDYADIMDGYAETFEDSASLPIDSALVQEEIPRTLDAMDAHYAVIEELLDDLDDLSKEKVEAFIERLKKSSAQLEESREVYAAAEQHQQHIACPSCSRPNPPENRNCEACGEILPRPEGVATASSTFSVLSGPVLEEHQQLEMTEHVAQLFQACDDVFSGAITHEQFKTELSKAAVGLKEFIDELDSIAALALDESNFTPEQFEHWKTHHLPYLEEVAVTFSAGIKEAEEGLQSMETFLVDPVQQHLIDGIRMVWEGLSAVHRGQLSLETYTKMIDDVLEEAAEEGLVTDG